MIANRKRSKPWLVCRLKKAHALDRGRAGYNHFERRCHDICPFCSESAANNTLWLRLWPPIKESAAVAFPSAFILLVSPVLSGRDQASTNPSLKILNPLTAANARSSTTRLWQLSGCYIECLGCG
jgi:hypothetical protein